MSHQPLHQEDLPAETAHKKPRKQAKSADASTPVKPKKVANKSPVRTSKKAGKSTDATAPRNATKSPVKDASGKVKAKPSRKAKSAKETKEAKPVVKNVKEAKRVASKSPPKQAKQAKKTKPKKTKPLPVDMLASKGHCVQPTPVSKILLSEVLYISEQKALAEIEATIKLCKPRPKTTNNPNPPPPQDLHITDLSQETQSIINDAETAYALKLKSDYEKAQVKDMSDDDKLKYKKAKNDAESDAKDSGMADFDLEAFNKTYNPKFYDGLVAYVKENDKHALKPLEESKTDSDDTKYKTEWDRAKSLIKNNRKNKINSGTHKHLGLFLDRVMEQLTHHAVHNCVLAGESSIQVKHALLKTNGYLQRMPLYNFITTLNSYNDAWEYVNKYNTYKDEKKKYVQAKKQEAKKKEVNVADDTPALEVPQKPEYNPAQLVTTFKNSVKFICDSMRRRLADDAVDEEDKQKYYNLTVSKEFKTYCEVVVHEVIHRLGCALKDLSDSLKVKTIRPEHMDYVINVAHNVCGMDYALTTKNMKKYNDIYLALKEHEAQLRKEKKQNPSDNENDTQELVYEE